MYDRVNLNNYTYTDMFLNAATKSPAKITLNYDSSSKTMDVNKAILTKSENSNIVEGTLIK